MSNQQTTNGENRPELNNLVIIRPNLLARQKLEERNKAYQAMIAMFENFTVGFGIFQAGESHHGGINSLQCDLAIFHARAFIETIEEFQKLASVTPPDALSEFFSEWPGETNNLQNSNATDIQEANLIGDGALQEKFSSLCRSFDRVRQEAKHKKLTDSALFCLECDAEELANLTRIKRQQLKSGGNTESIAQDRLRGDE
jgi:hypothetical protein